MSRPSTTELGNGDICPLVPEHGKMFMLSTGRQFCPHSDHSSHKPLPQRSMFEHDGITPTKVGAISGHNAS